MFPLSTARLGFVPHGRVELGAVVGRAKAFLLRNLNHRRVGTDAVNDARVQRPVSEGSGW